MEFFIQRAWKIWFHFFSLSCQIFNFFLWLHFLHSTEKKFALWLARLVHLVVLVDLVLLVLHKVRPCYRHSSTDLFRLFRKSSNTCSKCLSWCPVPLSDLRGIQCSKIGSSLCDCDDRLPEKNGHIGGQSLKEDRFLAGKISTFRGRTMEAWPNLNVNLCRSLNMSGRVDISATTSGNLKHQRLWVDKGKECSLLCK